MRCIACHYSLTNLTEHRCPECGRKFDPHDLNTFEQEAVRQFPKIAHVLVFAVCSFVGTIALLTYLDRGHQLKPSATALKTVTSLAITVCLVIVASIPYVLTSEWRARHRNSSK